MTYISTIMDNPDFLDVDVFRVAPEHSNNKIVNIRNRLICLPEEHVQKVLKSYTDLFIFVKYLNKILFDIHIIIYN